MKRRRSPDAPATLPPDDRKATPLDNTGDLSLSGSARHLGAGLSVIIKTLSPTQIFVGGEITEAWALLAPTIHRVIAERALTDMAAETPIVPELASVYPRLRGGTALVSAPLFAAPRIA